MMRAARLLLAGLVLLIVTPAHAGGSCADLPPDRQALAERVMAAIYPHDCCDDTLSACLAVPSPARLVKRLGAEVCRRVAAAQPEKDIIRSLERRAQSMLAMGRPAAVDGAGAALAGDPDAPVQVVVYACGRCPFCSRSLPAMVRAVREGSLKGVARLAYRAFPVRGHAHSAEVALAIEAARAMGKGWDMILKVYEHFDDFALERLPAWAAEIGLDRTAFDAKAVAPTTRAAVVVSKKEGTKNGVEATPTYFISGRRYKGDMADEALIDAILEEHERVRGVLCQP